MRIARLSAIQTTVCIANQDTALFIDRRSHEVEQIATGVRSTLHPDATALHGIGRRGVDRRPRFTRVERVRDVEMPFALEGCILE